MIGALLTPLLARISPRVRDYSAVAFSFLAAILATSLIPIAINYGSLDQQVEWIGLPAPFKALKAGILVDPLSVLLANIVAWISFLIMVYSLGYMKGEPSLTRYWFFMNFFIGNMLLLVLSDNFLQMFFGWEGVGLCSYGLIGFWHSDEKKYWVGTPPEEYPPSHAGMKAFVTTRIGDVCLLIAIFIIYSYAGSFGFLDLQQSSEWVYELGKEGLLAPVAILLFFGPVGKSAQFPLHEWLPEAMAGPTSVSALIHAATMVKAGVYLVARVLPIFISHLGIPGAQQFFFTVAWIGGITAFLAALQAIVAREIKKVLAYSTISQIGYMMLALGIAGFMEDFASAYVAGVFHLLSHAIFKATMFLAAGSIIHVCETKYMDEMGGLRKTMPITFLCMLLGALSLSGFPPLSGFWSKDAILVAILEAGQYPLFILAAITASITFFYSLRMIGLTFLGHESEHLKELEHEGAHIHEAPKVMYIPYLILAMATVFIGILGPFFEEYLHVFFEPILHKLENGASLHASMPLEAPLTHGALSPSIIALATSAIALLAGGIPAYWLYIARRASPKLIVERHGWLRGLQTLLWKRFYLNALYYRIFVYGLIDFSRGLFSVLELGIIDRISYAVRGFVMHLSLWSHKAIELGIIDRINYGVSALFTTISGWLRRAQTGILSFNMLEVQFGLLALIILIALRILLGG
jgi:NADH-quinone oxidoreductase subunit L